MQGRPVRVILDALGGVFYTLHQMLEPLTMRDVPSPSDEYPYLDGEPGILPE